MKFPHVLPVVIFMFVISQNVGQTVSGTISAEFVANDSVVLHIGTGNPHFSVGYNENSGSDRLGNEGVAPATLRNINLIMGFKLPKLTGRISHAALTVEKTGHNGAFSWSAQLYAFAPDVNPREAGAIDYEDVHYRGDAVDDDPKMILIAPDAMVQSTPNGSVTIDLTDSFKPGGPLAGFYNDKGVPISREGMIWFRFNSGDAADQPGLRLYINNMIGEEDSPTLEFTIK